MTRAATRTGAAPRGRLAPMTRRYVRETGATDGSIIAAIIVTHRPRNGASVSGAPDSPGTIPMAMSELPDQVSNQAQHKAATARSADQTTTVASRLPGELAVVAILSGVVEGPAVVGVVVGADRAARDGEVGAHRVEDVDDTHDRAVGGANACDLEVHDPWHGDPPGVAVRLEGDRHELHAELLTDQAGQHRRRAALGAGEDAAEGLPLGVVRPFVHVERRPPATLDHHLRGVDHQDDAKVVEPDPVRLALRDVHGKRQDASRVVRRPLQRGRDARTEHLAVAVLEVLAGQLPCHVTHLAPPPRPSVSARGAAARHT